MNPTITGAAAAEHQRDMLIRAAAARRARLLDQSIEPRNPRRRGVRRAHHGVAPFTAARAWLAAGQL
jgi:hypothetical protein